ncbi:hypothetical protein HDIA_0703 [Hartmannibacter diazotrophicus]|uniref:Uncharacterized protein n=1 Tax=Hartmannibacter diazotrophicus TaxID=1482074 RepID=A0A2C9D1Y7_9HYPH|nr:hypothetical protein [Hartmannibacter diazotrophicus]SON54244.1 hypothetical protein HDIA_0703 [Hartmannibacter diazotrophicus]
MPDFRMTISKAELMEQIEEARQNVARLESCYAHRISSPYLGTLSREKVICERCGGTLYPDAALQYARGFVAAGGAAEDVWPDWAKT